MYKCVFFYELRHYNILVYVNSNLINVSLSLLTKMLLQLDGANIRKSFTKSRKPKPLK